MRGFRPLSPSAQCALTAEQQYGAVDRLELGFMAASAHRDSDADGVADPDDSDTDGDGFPDASDATPYDADDDGLNNLNDRDDDSDGQSDHDEGVAGTDPLDAASLFQIETIEALPNGGIRLVWDGVRPRAYTVYTADDLTDPSPWTHAGNTNASATGSIQFTLPAPPADHFYRLGVTH